MIDSIVFYPLDSMSLEPGLNVIACELPSVLYKFVQGLRGEDDDVVLVECGKEVLAAKKVLFVGDCAGVLDYDALFQKAAVKKLNDGFNPEELSRLLLLQTEIKSIIQEEIWRENLPLSILDEADIKSMIAMAKPRVDTSSLGSLYDKIQLVVDTAGALAEGRMLVMLHITQYCDNGQLLYLHRELLRHHMQLLDLECCDKKVLLTEGRSRYIDGDYVQSS